MLPRLRDSQMYLLMLGQFLHVFSLNELADISNIYAKELSRIYEFLLAKIRRQPRRGARHETFDFSVNPCPVPSVSKTKFIFYLTTIFVPVLR